MKRQVGISGFEKVEMKNHYNFSVNERNLEYHVMRSTALLITLRASDEVHDAWIFSPNTLLTAFETFQLSKHSLI